MTVSAERGELVVPGRAMLDGRNPQGVVTVERINISKTPDRNPPQVAFSQRNNSPVSLISVTRAGDLIMFEIEANGMRGWVSELFVAPY